eukprot:860565_1
MDPIRAKDVKPESRKPNNTRSTATFVCEATRIRMSSISFWSKSSHRNVITATKRYDLPAPNTPCTKITSSEFATSPPFTNQRAHLLSTSRWSSLSENRRAISDDSMFTDSTETSPT